MHTGDRYKRSPGLSSFLSVILSGSLSLSAPATAIPQELQVSKENPAPLEIRISAPLRWHRDCLSISLDRINHSSRPLFLPTKGIWISLSVREVPDETGKTNGIEWINLYGLSDIGIWEADPIAPGKTVHSEYCLAPTIAVINLGQKTWREIPVQGKLRIDAYYFLTKEDWLTNRRQHQEMLELSEDELKRVTVLYPQASTAFSAIPCPERSCASTCDVPPTVLYGELRIVPDVYVYDSDWVARGHAVNEELAKKTEPCSDSKSIPP